MDGDGFIEYQRKAHDGLSNQGWKDSHDSVFHDDGTLAPPPIALCEVQGYVFAARQHASELARALGHTALAQDVCRQGELLRHRFHDAFWIEGLGMHALALDANKQPCAVRTSNVGHCLFSGIVPPDQARRVSTMLMDRSMYSGWGIRTVASNEPRYNPMSYHNGSIWPHDNAIIAAGLCRYGFRDEAWRIANGWFEASMFLDLHRLPELCCGFRRRRGRGPTLYPVACSPQAWAAGSVFMMLASCLGLSIDGVARQVRIHRPRLPRSVDDLRVRGLRLGDASIDLLFHRERSDVGVLVLRKDGPVDVVVTK
jgi:glycogen debranching enzyme